MQFLENSRVWIYQSDKKLDDIQTVQLQLQLDNFTRSWTAHNNQLKAHGRDSLQPLYYFDRR